MADMMQRRTLLCSPSHQNVLRRCPMQSALPHQSDPRFSHSAREQFSRARCPVGRPAASPLHTGTAQPGLRLAPARALPVSAPAIAGVEGSSLTVAVKVVVPYHQTHPGQQLLLVGGCESLGNWDVTKGVKFTWCEGHSHVAEVELPIHSTIDCKLVVQGDNNTAVWEPEANRELLLAPTSLASRAAGYTVVCHWGFPDCNQVLANALRRGNTVGSGLGATKPANGHHFGGAGDNPIIAGVKKALAQAGSKVLPGIASSWDEDGAGAEEEAVLVQCQCTVLLPPAVPKLKPEQSVVLVGSSSALGCWDPANGLPLERVGEDSPMWTTQAELPLGEGLLAKVVIVDGVTGTAQTWEPCENRKLVRHRGPKPVMVTAYWGQPQTHSLEVDRLSTVMSAGSLQVVQLLRQQLASTSTQLDGLRRERDDARRAMAASEEHMRSLESEVKLPGDAVTSHPRQTLDKSHSRFEMVQLAEQLQTTRKLYETTKKEANELGGAVGVTRQLCEAAKRELAGLAHQLEAAKRAYEALAPEVEKMERKLASTTQAFDATKPELVALEAQLQRARGLFDRTLEKIEAAKSLTGSGEFDAAAVRRRTENRLRELQFAKY